jgi:hypothetical protein
VGVNVLAGLLGGGGSAATVNSLAYSLESSVYILQERRDFDIINGSIEDEMIYINDWVLDEESVFADESYTVDVLFPRLMDLRNIELQIDFADKELYFPFTVSSIEIK